MHVHDAAAEVLAREPAPFAMFVYTPDGVIQYAVLKHGADNVGFLEDVKKAVDSALAQERESQAAATA